MFICLVQIPFIETFLEMILIHAKILCLISFNYLGKSEENNLEHGVSMNEILLHDAAGDDGSMKVKRRMGSEFLGKRYL